MVPEMPKWRINSTFASASCRAWVTCRWRSSSACSASTKPLFHASGEWSSFTNPVFGEMFHHFGGNCEEIPHATIIHQNSNNQGQSANLLETWHFHSFPHLFWRCSNVDIFRPQLFSGDVLHEILPHFHKQMEWLPELPLRREKWSMLFWRFFARAGIGIVIMVSGCHGLCFLHLLGPHWGA